MDMDSTGIKAHQFTACMRRPPAGKLEAVEKARKCPDEVCRLVDNCLRVDGDVLAREVSRQNAGLAKLI